MWLLIAKIAVILIVSFLAGAILGAFLRRNFNFEVTTYPANNQQKVNFTPKESHQKHNKLDENSHNKLDKSSQKLKTNADFDAVMIQKNQAIEAMRLRGEQIASEMLAHTNEASEMAELDVSSNKQFSSITTTSEIFSGYRVAQLNASLKSETLTVADSSKRPVGLFAPRNDTQDDLKIIKGIGPTNERKLNQIGIYHFDQIANWSAEECEWINSFLEFPGRVAREEWVEQAQKILTAKKL